MYHPQCEHRRHPRIRVSLPLRIWAIETETSVEARVSTGSCTNLSRGGIHAIGNEPVAPGRHLRLEITLPDGHRVDVAGRVAWSCTTVSPATFCSRQTATPDCSLGLEFVGEAPAELFSLIRNDVSAKRMQARLRMQRIGRRLLRS
jgi:hypothetical protein